MSLRDSHTVTGYDNDLFRAVKRSGIIDFFSLRFGGRGDGFLCNGAFGGLIDILDKFCKRLFGVTKIFVYAFLASIDRIFHACVAGFQVVVEDEYILAFIDREHGHTRYRRTFHVASGGVHNVVCTDYDSRVGVLELGIDVVHLEQILVLDVGLAKQYVHVPGHTSSHGVNGVFDFRAVCGKLIGKLFNEVLSLCNSHTVAGNEDNFLSVL